MRRTPSATIVTGAFSATIAAGACDTHRDTGRVGPLDRHPTLARCTTRPIPVPREVAPGRCLSLNTQDVSTVVGGLPRVALLRARRRGRDATGPAAAATAERPVVSQFAIATDSRGVSLVEGE